MTEEFLKNFQVGGQAIPQEVITEILAENVRDIDVAKAPFADYNAIKEQLQTAKDGLKAFEGVDVENLRGQITTLQNTLATKETEYQNQLAEMTFNHALESAITAAHGRNAKAIQALLDLDALKGSKNQEADIKAALDGLKQETGYLFESEQVPPPYSPGTGAKGPQRKYTQEELANMSMADYRAYRQGKN